MTDYAYVQIIARIADNPELEPLHDKVMMTSSQSESDGFAREDNHWIIKPGDTVDLDFDAFKDSDWIDVAFQNEGDNDAEITLTDDMGVEFTLPLLVGASLLLRCYKVIPKPGGAPSMTSAGGTRVHVFAWGEHWEGEPQ